MKTDKEADYSSASLFCHTFFMLFADHDVKNHVVCMLHSYRTDAPEVYDGLFNVFLYDAVMLGDAYAFACKDCRLKCR